MSPSEDDLRAVLHDGADAHVDVEQLVLGARAAAGQRRIRMLSAAAIVAVVAGGGVGGALIANSGGGSKSSAQSTPLAGQALGAAGAATNSSAARPAPLFGLEKGLASCPATVPVTPQPDRTAASSTSAQLFAKPIASLVVCAYTVTPHPTTSGPEPESLLLSGAQARRVVASLENAPKAPPHGVMCPDIRGAEQRALLLIGRTRSGAPAGQVTVSLALSPCEVRVTNGTAVRFAWTPPAALAQLLHSAGTVPVPAPSSSPS
jgi:hypothetical protein